MTSTDHPNESITELVDRERLFAVAYRLLGNVADAQDALQEALLRWHQADQRAIVNPAAWLTTVITHWCLDRLRSSRAAREEYVGQWLPDPLVDDTSRFSDPAESAIMVESLHLATMVVLETLSPSERAVFVLHDAFGYPFDKVAETVGGSPTACRQLASRARRHLRERRTQFTVDAAEQHAVVSAFLEASRQGDLDELVALLDPSVLLRADGGGKAKAALRPVTGSLPVARIILAGVASHPGAEIALANINGSCGIVLRTDDRILGVAAFAIRDHQIVEIDIVLNPDKLRSQPMFGATSTRCVDR